MLSFIFIDKKQILQTERGLGPYLKGARSLLGPYLKGARSLSKVFFVQCNLYGYICLILLEKQFDEV